MLRPVAIPLSLLAVAFFTAPSPDAQEATQGDLLRLSNYLNGLNTLAGRFVQRGPDGGVSEGTVHLRRPGRMRFDYDPPDSTLIVADGTWVGICDPQTEAVERFPLSETPFGLLLGDRVDLRRENAVRSVGRSAGRLHVEIVDPDAPDQGAITLSFDDNPPALRQWVVVDNQGLTTTVALRDVRTGGELGGELFFIDDENCGG